MKENSKIIYISEILLLIYILILTMYLNAPNDLKNISLSIVLTIVLTILALNFGIKKDNSYIKGSAARTVVASLMIYMLLIYSLGIILGFNKGYSLLSRSVQINFILMVIISINTELIRYIIARNCFKDVKPLFVFTLLSFYMNIILELNINTLITAEDKFIFLSTIIFPVIAEESLCTYMTYKMALLPSLIYKLVMKLYLYLLPIVPSLGDYIYSSINVIFPFAIYNVLNRMVIKYEKEKQYLKKMNKFIFTIPLIVIFVILVILVSGIFRYKLIAIASNSMKPTYSRGDAVIYEKVNIDNYQEGDILAFQNENRIVTHRIVKIIKNNNEYRFITKGDNNNANDVFISKNENVLGKVRMAFKYIGYPTVLINELFGKE